MSTKQLNRRTFLYAITSLGAATLGIAGYLAINTTPKQHEWVLYKMGPGTIWNSLDRGKLDTDIRDIISQIEHVNRERSKNPNFQAGRIAAGAEIWMPKEYLLHPENIVSDPNYQAQSGVKEGR